MNIKFSERFHQNLDEILAFIAKDGIEKAVKFRGELYEKLAARRLCRGVFVKTA